MRPDTENRDNARWWRRGETLAGIATVVVLAVVVFVAGSLSPTGKLPKDETANQATASRQFAQRAQEALNSGDATLAATLAQQALDADGSNTAAQSIQDKANEAKADGSSGSSGTSSGNGNDSSDQPSESKWYTKSGANLKKLLPGKVAGYDMSSGLPGDKEIQKSGTSTIPNGQVANAVWTVREMKSTKDAKAFLTRTSKELFANDSLSVQVDGVDAYFGTDAARYATCVYVRGLYVFEVLATSNNVRPSAIRRQVVDAAKAFPDNP